MAFVYNKKIFDQYQLTVPTTWDEFAQQAEKLAKASNGKVKMTDFFPTHAPWFIGLAWASGGDFFKAKGDTWIQTLNNSASEKVLTFWDGLIKKDTFRLCPILPRNFTPHSVLSGLHLGTVDFLSPAILLFSIGNIVTWTWTGYNMITLFAALQNIPKDIFEAARVDGATTWNIVRYIKIPLIIPTLQLCLIFSIIGTSQLFTEAFVMRPLGYVADNVTPNLYLYLTAARDANYAYAGALAIFMAVIIFALSGAFLRRISSRST